MLKYMCSIRTPYFVARRRNLG